MKFLEIKVIDYYKFNIKINESVSDSDLYFIIFSYLKNNNLVIKHVNILKSQTLGVEYINLISILNFSLYDFIIFKQQHISDVNNQQDSNFYFIDGVSDTSPLIIEITTFNKHNICIYTKPIKLNFSN